MADNENTNQPQEEDKVVVTGRPARFSLDEARSELKLNGILPTNRFIVIFSLPAGIKEMADYQSLTENGEGYNHADSDNFLSLRCEGVQIPGVNFFTNDEIRRYGIGQTEKRPYIPTFNAITLLFNVDRNAKVINFFNKWTNGIINYNTDFGMNPAAGKKYKPYLLKYRDHFMSPTVRIWVYDESNLNSFGIKLYEAYPQQTGDINLNWGNNNDMMRYSVLLQFSHMTMQFSNRDALVRKERFGTTPKSASEVLNDSIAENKKPDLLNRIFDITGKMVHGEIYSGAERIISKSFDSIFK